MMLGECFLTMAYWSSNRAFQKRRKTNGDYETDYIVSNEKNDAGIRYRGVNDEFANAKDD